MTSVPEKTTNTRSSSRIQARNRDGSTSAATNQQHTNKPPTPQMSTNAILPLMSLQFPTGPQTSSSPESGTTIQSPEYSSNAARSVVVEERANIPRMPRLNEEVNPEMPVNGHGLSLQDYIRASVGSAQAMIMKEVQDNLKALVPQIIRDSLRSEQNSIMETQPGNQTNRNNHHDRTPDQNHNNTNCTNQNSVPQFNQHQTQNQYTPQNTPTYHHNSPLQMEKWGFKYDGNNQVLSVEDFVFRVEALREDYQCPWSTFMKDFQHLVTGGAQQWFWNFRRQNPSCEWPHLRYHLLRKFRRYDSDFEIQRKIMERRQHPTESADSFIAEIVKLQNQLKVRIPEYELVRLVKDNLKEGVTQLIFPMEISSLDHLLEECRRAERNIAKRPSYRLQPNHPRRINELEYEGIPEEENQYQIEAVNHTSTPGKQLICWNCKTPGHTFIDCTLTQRNLFCYRCGFENVISPNCPKCKGNSQKNMMKTGPTCSTQNQLQ
ncbi:hypothetical protein CVS40_4887 [Lucilia cuprina]|nr:hypothetical protein CVS40_4887 [Lucilia cuprina]